MPEYINPNSYIVYLVDQQGEQIQVRPGQKITLNEYFDRYQARGFIKRVGQSKPTSITNKLVQKRLPKNIRQVPIKAIRTHKITAPLQNNNPAVNAVGIANTPIPPKPDPPKQEKSAQNRIKQPSKPKPPSVEVVNRARARAQHRIVGRAVNADAAELLRINLDRSVIPISNNIGVGILSYNRKDCLKRLVESITKNTDLRRTTIFISDDHSTDQATLKYLDEIESNSNIVVIRNDKRLGIAGNSNRLIRCLSRFKYGIILNDDVEILKQNWDYLYPEAMATTNMHHFIYRQVGVYAAKRGDVHKINDQKLLVVKEKPHGAVLAFTHDMLVKCGYFDESYGFYGMEHVDWSQRVWELSLQPEGFWDVSGSEEYFKIHSDPTVVSNKSEHLKHARELFKKRIPSRVGPTKQSRVPEIDYVIPFRNADREDCIRTVVDNVRAQRYPVVHIILIEQDNKINVDVDAMRPAYHELVTNKYTDLFNKSQAFNVGVFNAVSNKIILHDADMLVQGDYTQNIADALDTYESCHMGKMVLYADPPSTRRICDRGIVDETIECNRIVGYFEGGSLACTKHAYWRVGAFCEDFWGYGVEDCDFYARISNASKWLENRKFDFLHLHHGRAPHWDDHHNENITKGKQLERLSIAKRIQLQQTRLRELGWSEETLALGRSVDAKSLDFHCFRDGNRTVKIVR